MRTSPLFRWSTDPAPSRRRLAGFTRSVALVAFVVATPSCADGGAPGGSAPLGGDGPAADVPSRPGGEPPLVPEPSRDAGGTAAPSGGDAGAVADAGVDADPAARGPRVLTILHTTDLHTNLEPWDYGRGVADEKRGLVKVATLIERERAQSPCTLLVDTGDTIQGTPLGTYFALEDTVTEHPMAQAMNALRYDAMAMGNHELNFGPGVLRRFAGAARFPLLAANVRTKDDGEAFTPYVIKDVCGVRIGILGLITPGVPLWEKPDNYAGLVFADLVATAKRYVPVLRQAGADVVVVAMHSGPEEALVDVCDPSASPVDAGTDGGRRATPAGGLPWANEDHAHDEGAHEASALREEDGGTRAVPPLNAAVDLARRVPGVDAILTGHTHRAIGGRCVGETVLEQPGRWGSHLGKVRLFVEGPAGKVRVVARDAQILPVNETVPKEPRLEALVRPLHEKVLAYVERPVAEAKGAFRGGYAARFEDSALADLVHEAQLAAVRDAGFPADVSIAAIYSDAALPEGRITLRDLFGVYVYDNTLTAMEITGAQLRRALEQNASYFRAPLPSPLPPTLDGVLSGAPDYNWDQYAGVDYTVDLTQPLGSRVTRLVLRGAPLANDAVLRVAVNNYRGSGAFAAGKLLWSSADTLVDFLAAYLQRAKTVDPATLGACNFRLEPDLFAAYFGPSTKARCSRGDGELLPAP